MSKPTPLKGSIFLWLLATIVIAGFVLIGLRLLHVVMWSWWWVLAPFWGGFALVAGVCLLTLFVMLVSALVS